MPFTYFSCLISVARTSNKILNQSSQGNMSFIVSAFSSVQLLSRVRLFATPWTVAYHTPPSMGFSRQEYWSGLPFPSPMHESEKWKWSRSVVSESSRPHGLQPTRLLHPWDFPGKSTGVGCHCLLHPLIIIKGWKIFLKQSLDSKVSFQRRPCFSLHI